MRRIDLAGAAPADTVGRDAAARRARARGLRLQGLVLDRRARDLRGAHRRGAREARARRRARTSRPSRELFRERFSDEELAALAELLGRLPGRRRRRRRVHRRARDRLGAREVLVVGSGGREHALAWKLAQSPSSTSSTRRPGNPGIAALGSCHPVRADDAEGLIELSTALDIDLVVIGPEAPLVAGRRRRTPARGRLRLRSRARRRRASKARRPSRRRSWTPAGVPTASTSRYAAGALRPEGRRPRRRQGRLRLPNGRGAAGCALPRAEALGDRLVVEELLEGEELSRVRALRREQMRCRSARRATTSAIGDGDAGPNTGGHGRVLAG